MLPFILLLLNTTYTANYSIICIMLGIGNDTLKTNIMDY